MTTQRGDARRTPIAGEACLDVAALYAAVNADRLRRAKAYPADFAGGTTSYSWQRVSRESGVSPAVLSKLEGAVTAPSADTLVRLLVWLGKTDIAPFITSATPAQLPSAPAAESDASPSR